MSFPTLRDMPIAGQLECESLCAWFPAAEDTVMLQCGSKAKTNCLSSCSPDSDASFATATKIVGQSLQVFSQLERTSLWDQRLLSRVWPNVLPRMWLSTRTEMKHLPTNIAEFFQNHTSSSTRVLSQAWRKRSWEQTLQFISKIKARRPKDF